MWAVGGKEEKKAVGGREVGKDSRRREGISKERGR